MGSMPKQEVRDGSEAEIFASGAMRNQMHLASTFDRINSGMKMGEETL